MWVTQTHNKGHPQNLHIPATDFTTSYCSILTIFLGKVGIEPNRYKNYKSNRKMHFWRSYEGYKAVFHTKRTDYPIF